MNQVADAPISTRRETEAPVQGPESTSSDGKKVVTRRKRGGTPVENADVSYALAAEEPKDGLPKFTQVLTKRSAAASLAFKNNVPLYMIQKMRVVEKEHESGGMLIDAEPATTE